MKRRIWIVGQHFESLDQPNRCWEFQGIFDEEYKAIQACHADHFFIFSAQLNEVIAIETLPPVEDSYFPRLETKEQAQERRKK